MYNPKSSLFCKLNCVFTPYFLKLGVFRKVIVLPLTKRRTRSKVQSVFRVFENGRIGNQSATCLSEVASRKAWTNLSSKPFSRFRFACLNTSFAFFLRP